MAQDTSDTPPPYDFAGQVIRIEAGALARGYGLDAERVQRILARTATDAYGRPLQPPARGQDNLEHGLQFHPTLEEALAYLSAEEALTVFERTDPTALRRRVHLVAYLSAPAGAYHTLDELADLLDRYGRHLEQNRDTLLRTGYPQVGFGRSPWLDWHLSLLSPTKLPVSAFDRPADLPPPYDGHQGPLAPHEQILHEKAGLLPQDKEGNLVYSFVWATETGELAWSQEGPWFVRRDGSFEHLVPVERCGYAEAALVEGLPTDVAQRLDAGRTTLFRAKLDVLEACVRCLRSRDAVALWPAVLGILTELLLWDDVQRYLGVEKLYQTVGLGERVAPSYWLRAPGEVPGTLSALLSLVGHVEKELRIGTFAETKAVVREALARTGLVGLESYFQAVGHPGQVTLDAALDGFWALEEQERSYWDAFRRRVNAALENDFCEEVIIRTRVKRPLVAKFEPYLQTFAEWQRVQLETTGTLTSLHLSSPSEAPEPRPNVFRRQGKAWIIEYDGQSIPMNDRRGMHYIAHLLQRPGEQIHVLDLDRAVRLGISTSSGPPQERDARLLREQGLRLADSGDAGPRLDPKSKEGFGRRLRALRDEREEAEELGDEGALARIDWEVEEIERELSAGFGLGGRPRRDRAASERARTNVTNQIREARAQIAERHPRLAQHLHHIRTGTYCWYDPGVDRVPWEF